MKSVASLTILLLEFGEELFKICFVGKMAGYFEEMGWSELRDGEQPNHLLHMARFLLDVGVYDEDFSGQWPR